MYSFVDFRKLKNISDISENWLKDYENKEQCDQISGFFYEPPKTSKIIFVGAGGKFDVKIKNIRDALRNSEPRITFQCTRWLSIIVARRLNLNNTKKANCQHQITLDANAFDESVLSYLQLDATNTHPYNGNVHFIEKHTCNKNYANAQHLKYIDELIKFIRQSTYEVGYLDRAIAHQIISPGMDPVFYFLAHRLLPYTAHRKPNQYYCECLNAPKTIEAEKSNNEIEQFMIKDFHIVLYKSACASPFYKPDLFEFGILDMCPALKQIADIFGWDTTPKSNKNVIDLGEDENEYDDEIDMDLYASIDYNLLEFKTTMQRQIKNVSSNDMRPTYKTSNTKKHSQ